MKLGKTADILLFERNVGNGLDQILEEGGWQIEKNGKVIQAKKASLNHELIAKYFPIAKSTVNHTVNVESILGYPIEAYKAAMYFPNDELIMNLPSCYFSIFTREKRVLINAIKTNYQGIVAHESVPLLGLGEKEFYLDGGNL